MSHSRILVVENEGIVADDIQDRLARLGYSVTTVLTGQQALEQCGQKPFDLALMDVVLRGRMDGVEAAIEMRRRFDIPVVFLTAHADDATLLRAKQAKPYGYLIKPFEERGLHSVIELALDKHAMERSQRQRAKQERELIEIQLRQAQKLECLGRLAPRLLDEMQASQTVEQAVKIMEALTEFLCADSRSKAPVNLNQAILSALIVSQSEWKPVAEVVTELDLGLPPVPCFSGEIHQVFLNLLLHAAQSIGESKQKENPQKGMITVRTRSEGNWAEIQVSDTGPAIPEEWKENIFDPFKASGERGQDSGLGLSIVQGIVVKHHGGTITVESKPGPRATFIVRLPMDGRKGFAD